jgi:hypothetical protein
MTRFAIQSIFEEGGSFSDLLKRDDVQEVLDTVQQDVEDGALCIQIYVYPEDDVEWM